MAVKGHSRAAFLPASADSAGMPQVILAACQQLRDTFCLAYVQHGHQNTASLTEGGMYGV